MMRENSIQRLRAVAVLVFCLINSSAKLANGEDPLVIDGPIFGTSYSVKVWPVHSNRLDELNRKIAARLHEIDHRMSTYKSESEVSRFNRAPAGTWFAVSDETAHLVARALEQSRLTDGAFDITVGPLVRLWNFGSQSVGNGTSRSELIPSDEEILRTMQSVGFEKLQVRFEPPSLLKTRDHVEIDLSAIAKGYAVDQVAELLAKSRIDNFLVEIGGEIRCLGSRSPGESWTIGIEDPRADSRSSSTFLSLSDASIASSGDYRNFFEVDGTRYSHTIDPRSGRPVRHRFAASTVWDDNCARADALATALLVMGDTSLDWCEDNGVRALLFERKDDSVVMHRSSFFPDLIFEGRLPPREGVPSTFWRLAIVSACVFGLALAAMAIGVILSNRRIKGSCGGMAGLTDGQGRPLCEGCTNPSPECETDPAQRRHLSVD